MLTCGEGVFKLMIVQNTCDPDLRYQWDFNDIPINGDYKPVLDFFWFNCFKFNHSWYT